MDFGIAHLSIIPVRFEPTHRSEMVTQLLFGELYRITGAEGEWRSIKLAYDDYEGWINVNQLNPIPEQEFIRLFDADTAIAADLVQILENGSTHDMMPIVVGSSLPSFDGNQLVINHTNYFYDGQTANTRMLENVTNPHDLMAVRQQLVTDAMLYLNAPYLWGGRSPLGIDCSGFVQMVYKLKRVKLLRDASQQATQGEVVALLDEAEPGDLAFFDNEEEVITHVGMLIDQHHIIHCSGKVRIDPIDHQGIYDETQNRYTHKLRLIKRMI